MMHKFQWTADEDEPEFTLRCMADQLQFIEDVMRAAEEEGYTIALSHLGALGLANLLYSIAEAMRNAADKYELLEMKLRKAQEGVTQSIDA